MRFRIHRARLRKKSFLNSNFHYYDHYYSSVSSILMQRAHTEGLFRTTKLASPDCRGSDLGEFTVLRGERNSKQVLTRQCVPPIDRSWGAERSTEEPHSLPLSRNVSCGVGKEEQQKEQQVSSLGGRGEMAGCNC